MSGRLSDDWERLRAFCADPKMPSLLKLGALPAFIDVGDFSTLVPFAPFICCGGISMENASGLGIWYLVGCDVPVVVPAECGESPVDDGDILRVRTVL